MNSRIESRNGTSGLLAFALMTAGCTGGGSVEVETSVAALLPRIELAAWVANPADPAEVVMNWSDIQGETNYAIDRSVNGRERWKEIALVDPDQTWWEDSDVKADSVYCYRVRPIPATIADVSNVSCSTTPIVFQAQSLARTQSSGTSTRVKHSEPNKGTYLEIDVGSNGWVEFKFRVENTGVYELILNHAIGPYFGAWDLSLDGTPVGSVDAYYDDHVGFQGPAFGTFEVNSAPSTKTLRFQVTGKADASSGYKIGLDTIVLLTSGPGRFEAESSSPSASKHDKMSVVKDPLASNGKIVSGALDAVSDNLEFTLPVKAPGDYLMALRIKRGPSAGKIKAFLDEVAIPDGEFDGYAPSLDYATQTLSSLSIPSSGKHSLRLSVVGKSVESQGYDLIVDWIELRAAPSKNCVGKASGESCNDDNLCTTGDVCQQGVCQGPTQVECPVSSSCVFQSWCDSSTGVCQAPSMCSTCGNGLVEYGEECDDGNTNQQDGCNNLCRESTCGDGIVQSPVTDLTFHYLGRTCGDNPGDVYFVMNGVEVARSPIPTSCDCQPGIIHLPVSVATLLPLLRKDPIVVEMHFVGEMAWGGYTYNDASGAYRSQIFDDANGGQDWENQNPDLCIATTSNDYIGIGIYGDFGGGEECDDGNTVDNDACSNTCALNPQPPTP